MSSFILGLELQELPIELIKKLIEKGAKHRSEFLRAVSFSRIHVVNCMLDAGIHWKRYQSALAVVKKEGNEGMVKALEK